MDTRGPKRPVTDGSDGQGRLGRTFQENGTALSERVGHMRSKSDMCKRKLATADQTCKRTVQVLQFVLLNGTIGIAVVMTAMRRVSGYSPIGEYQLSFHQMRRVLAQELNDAARLGEKE